MKGYRSIDGNCVIKAKLILSPIIDVWVHAFVSADELEKVEFKQGLYYKVRNVTVKEGLRVYRYKLLVVDESENLHYIILIDAKGYARIEIYYPAQRTSAQINLGYRDLFQFLRFRVQSEVVSRVDLALTIEKSINEVVDHVLTGKFYSLLSRKKLVSYGEPGAVTSLRFGDLKNVEIAIYDKGRELFDKAFEVSYGLKLDDYYAVFGNSQEVTRIEYRLTRTYLRNVGLRTPEDINSNIFELFLTMQERYFMPLDRVPDGHHKFSCSQWWNELPPMLQKYKDQQGRIMFNTDLLSPVGWVAKYKMMMARTEGYIASIVASMARVEGNIDNALQIVFQRLIESSDNIYVRAKSRFVLT